MLLGTCTDVHDQVQTKISAARTQEQLLSVLTHSKVTLFTVDMERRVTLLEGSLIWDKAEELSQGNRWFIGQNMYAVFNRLTDQLPEGQRPEFLQPIEDILDGHISEGLREHQIGKQHDTDLVTKADVEQMTSTTERGLFPSRATKDQRQKGQLRVSLV